MKAFATICLVIFCQLCGAMDRFAALSMLESGDCDTCVGRYGEITRYQILPAVQRQFDPTGRLSALAVAQAVMQDRCSAFAGRHGRPPTDFEFYLLWHRPACLLSRANRQPTKREADRAQRFANLCSK